ncbi:MULTISPECIES: hypothetical protein [Pasteurellaceae]|uniref:Uncharacterized protein n=1 Tax=Haemophilus haemolyticus TaxID=726 RepID=A0A502LFG8_HAEHA|nr:hypothetical protein [Haemophilus haemolyticus]TPH21809.1 hypothetical protein EUX48_07445 [Haemophilus haemolyticus]
MEFLPLIVLVLVWYFVAKYFKNKGRGKIVRHLAGFVVGFVGLVIAAVMVAPNKAETPTKTETTQQVVESTPTKEEVVTPQSEQVEKAESAQTESQVTEKTVEQLEVTEEVKEEPKTEAEKPEQTLDLDVKKFSSRIGRALKNAQSPYKMTKNPKITDGEVNDVVNYMFTERFGLIITLDKKTHKVKSMMTVVTPSPTNTDENILMVLSNSAVLSAFEGDNEIKTLGKKIMELTMSVMTEYSEKHQDVSKTIIWNGKKYGVSASKYTGIISSANFAD